MSWDSRVRRAYRGGGAFVSTLALLSLAGCGPILPGGDGEDRAARLLLGTGAQATQGADALGEGPVAMIDPEMAPDPDAFSAEASVTWDGERTLQGVWIAHPEAEAARRVRIVNTGTGAAVDGALFRRDAGLDGPSVLISSDAAVALGIAAGGEAQLSITAIRYAPVPPEDEAPGRQVAAAGAETLGGSPAAPSVPEADVAGTEIPSGETAADMPASPAVRAGAAEPPATGGGDADARAGTDARTQTQIQTETETEIRTAPGTPAGTVAEAAATEPPRLRVTPEMQVGGGTAQPAAASAGREAAAPLSDPRRAGREGVAPAPDEPAEETAGGRWERARDDAPARLAVLSPERDLVPAPAAAPGPGLDRPFVQAGIFAVRGNAERLIARLREAGLPAMGKPFDFRGRPATRVVAGPFETAAARDAALAEMRRIGPDDAVPVRE